MRDTTKILQDLRSLMKNLPNGQGSIGAYIITSDDAHQNEYICQHDERRRFVTGFDGSAGTAVVTQQNALLWTDGRYYQHATKQMDSNWTLMKQGLTTTPSIGEWLAKNLERGEAVGADPKLMSARIWQTIESPLHNNANTLQAVESNLIDLIWAGDQPAQVSNKVITLSTTITGKTIGDKLQEIRTEMKEKNVTILVVTALDEVAWLLNLRGSDIDYNPVFFAYVIVTLDNITLFIDSVKLPASIENHFIENNVKVQVEKYNNVQPVLESLARETTSKVWISIGSSQFLTSFVAAEKRLQEITPVAVMKAIKNNVEAVGMENCHIRDGAALCQYFAWLEEQILAGKLVTEISGATKLEEFRKKQAHFMGLSFPTISSSGPNGSIIHYHPEKETDRQITADEMYLCDSGAQYLDGTTDVTRTWHFGKPSAHEIECFTRVLKGQITLGTTIFPNKIKGHVLDTLARKALWDVGLDYQHGTGHGVGHFLNVHEGPILISYRLAPDDSGLQENMFVSNEPGYYEDGKFGIRIEDIVRIVPATHIANNFNGRGALTFKTITMCPIQSSLIDVGMLTDKEKSTLNAYHQTVFNTLHPLLKNVNDDFTIEWLRKKTLPV